MKKFVQWLVLILVISACIIGYILIQNQKTIIETQAKLLEPRLLNTIGYTKLSTIFPSRGDIIKESRFNGSVINSQIQSNQTINVAYNERSNPIAECVKQGDLVKDGDIIVRTSRHVIKSEVNGRVATVENKGGKVRVCILNYDNYVINFFIPVAVADLLDINQHVNLVYQNKYQLEGIIKFISWVAQEGDQVNVQVSYNDINCITREGASVAMNIVTEAKSEVIILPKECVLQNGKDNYVVQIAKKGQDDELYYPCVAVSIGIIGEKTVEIIKGVDLTTEVVFRPEKQYGEPLSELSTEGK